MNEADVVLPIRIADTEQFNLSLRICFAALKVDGKRKATQDNPSSRAILLTVRHIRPSHSNAVHEQVF